MIAALIIVFREVLEAALVVSIVLAATGGVPAAKRWVGLGVLCGIAGSAVVAQFAGVIADSLSGYGQEIFNASVLLLAVFMLAWHNAWMAVHGREIAQEMRAVGNAVREGGRPLYALAVVVGLAVMREGSETVLFLYGLAASDGGFADAVSGGAAGLAIGVAVGAALYLGLLRIPTRHLFSVTSWMITLLAAGMAAQSMTFLSAAGIVDLGSVLWDSSALLSENSIPGKILHTLVGYMDRPTVLQVAVYLGALALIYGATKFVAARHQAAQRMASAE
ncbi:FTR1 family iron permease [Aestuariispira ectoiniformans]|uniref:FTR1 family iron permease n=1 Tax=Aestuariispira ectoiniformans TaxID=2775080 RepID=UPI0028834D55|nr:FTR1 family protein [Aestuariispira ectoiniformans]